MPQSARPPRRADRQRHRRRGARRCRRRDVREAHARHRRGALRRSRARDGATSTRRSPPRGAAQPAWARGDAAERGAILRRIAQLLERDRDEIAAIVAAETGQVAEGGRAARSAARSRWATSSPARAGASTARTTTSAVPNRQAMTIRQPLGVAGPDHRRQHADRERRVEGVPGAAVRQRRGAQGLGGHARDRARVRPARRRGGAAAGRPQRRPGLRRGGRPAARRAPRRGRRELHRLDRRRPDDRPASRASGSRRSASSSAARTRSSSATTPTSRRRRDAAALSAYSQRRPALRGGQPADRLRRGLRRVPRRCCSSARAPSGSGPATSTTSAR